MIEQKDQILAEALKLKPMERAELVEQLLSSFEFPSRKIIDALWAEEAENRVKQRGQIFIIDKCSPQRHRGHGESTFQGSVF